MAPSSSYSSTSSTLPACHNCRIMTKTLCSSFIYPETTPLCYYLFNVGPSHSATRSLQLRHFCVDTGAEDGVADKDEEAEAIVTK